MDKTEKYEALKETLREVTKQQMSFVSVQSDGSRIPYAKSVTEQEYTVWFSNGSRHLILSTEAVRFALEENLGKINESIRYFARQKIEEYLKKAKEERQDQLDSLNKEKIGVKVEVK